MSTSIDLGGGGNSFAFDTVGDSVSGKIVNLSEVQQTDMDSGQPAVWDNGQPKMMVAVELATTLRDPANPADDGKRTVYLKGSRKPESMSSMAAVLTAVRNASGATTLNVGGTLTLTYASDGIPTRKGWNAPKQYAATYSAPSVDLGGGQQAQAAPAYTEQVAPAQTQLAATPPAQVGFTSPEQAAAFAQYQADQARLAQQG